MLTPETGLGRAHHIRWAARLRQKQEFQKQRFFAWNGRGRMESGANQRLQIRRPEGAEPIVHRH